MAKVEVEQETGDVSRPAPPAELVVGIPGLVDAAQVRDAAEEWVRKPSDEHRRSAMKQAETAGFSSAEQSMMPATSTCPL